MWGSTILCNVRQIQYNKPSSSCQCLRSNNPTIHNLQRAKVYTGTCMQWNGISKFTTSPNGWVIYEIFQNHFLVHETQRYLILLYDGHATHIILDVNDLARKDDVHMFILPPHSSHILQPLDVLVFSPFKKSLSLKVFKYLHDNPNNVSTRQLLPGII